MSVVSCDPCGLIAGVIVDDRLRDDVGRHFVLSGLNREPQLFESLRVAGGQCLRKLGNISLIRASGPSAILPQPAFLAGLVGFLRALRDRCAVEVIDPHVLSAPLSPS